MNWIDFWVVFAVVVAVGLIVYFGPIKRRLAKAKHGGEVNACPNCPVGNDKKARRLIRDFHKQKAREEKNKR
jgi:hypothetical protein